MAMASSREGPRGLRLLVLGWLLLLGVAGWSTDRIPIGHEEISTFPARGPRVLDTTPDHEVDVTGPLRFEASCGDPDAPTLVRSSVRPQLSLCAGGLSLPVLIASYATGVAQWHALIGWPLHRGDAIGLRRWNLFAGLVSLTLAFFLVRRLSDGLTAGVTALVLPVIPSFTLLSSMLLQYEVTPWILTMAAAAVALGPRAPPADASDREASTTRRWLVTGLLAGLAITANVKAVFFLPPVLLVALRVGALRRLDRHGALVALGGMLAGVAPLVLANRAHGGGGLEAQAAGRTSLLLQPTSLDQVQGEAINLLRFAADTGSYAQASWDPLGPVGVLAAVVMALAAMYALAQAARVLVGRGGQPLAATCGVLLVLFLVVSLKLYDQQVAANYGPLHGVFGIMLALAIVAAARTLSRTGVSVLSDVPRTALVLAAVCVGALGWNTLRRIALADEAPLSMNATAERELAAFLVEQPDPEATIYTSTYNLAGVLDALGKGAIATVRIDRVLSSCGGSAEALDDCLVKRWTQLLERPDGLPARVVLPAVDTLSDEPEAMRFAPTLEVAAARAGLGHAVEAQPTIGGRGDRPALRLVRVDRR
jgi:hypothetical protein